MSSEEAQVERKDVCEFQRRIVKQDYRSSRTVGLFGDMAQLCDEGNGLFGSAISGGAKLGSGAT